MRRASVFWIAATFSALHAQPGFEVASVKRNPGAPPGHMTFQASPGGHLTVENMPLLLLIQRAYGVRAFQVAGGPSWIDADRYDIDAKAGHDVPEDQVTGPMLQALLENRCHLKVRREAREMPVLNLTQATTGTRLTKSNAADCDPTLPCHEVVLSISPAGARLRGQQATTAQLVFTLANIMGRPVLDQTALTQAFDLDLQVNLGSLDGIAGFGGLGASTIQTTDSQAPSILTALPQQLGLKLTPGKGPIEVLVIDHVDRPTEN
jgi:uncharacterized protein (TIGR03435 family)